MLFNSLEYAVFFLPISVILFFIFKKLSITLSKIWLCISSIYFYSFFTAQFLPVLISSMIVNYALIRAINHDKTIKSVSLSIIFNVISLGYFKYCNFFIFNIEKAFDMHLANIEVIAPLAISFYTFQQISLSVSIYRKNISDIPFIDYCCYILFFPKLISGPITNYEIITSQLNSRSLYLGKYFAPAVFIFSIGVFKKVVLASYFGVIADQGYANVSSLSIIDSWVTSLSYSMQLYFDFSGYTDMAIGSAMLFGVILPVNFNSPYLASDLQDFWRRWHITLSTWLRNFVYIPLGGNRKGSLRTYVNLFLTFLIGGFWHGAGWNFLVWGALHGAGLVIHRLWSQMGLKMPSIIGWFVTFNFVNVTWIFFRTDNIPDAALILKKMFLFSGNIQGSLLFNQPFADAFFYAKSLSGPYMLVACLAAIAICLNPFNSNLIISMTKNDKAGVKWNIVTPALCAFGLCLSVYVSLGGAAPGSFIYFNF
ncbi:D-alanyl-lipoteichoic acid biosynthesis protein DltB [Cedecea davisae]|nr:D-alanyl-lipoteichoic acid biosynthesis protein DltB [Cedecea davisae]